MASWWVPMRVSTRYLAYTRSVHNTMRVLISDTKPTRNRQRYPQWVDLEELAGLQVPLPSLPIYDWIIHWLVILKDNILVSSFDYLLYLAANKNMFGLFFWDFIR